MDLRSVGECHGLVQYNFADVMDTFEKLLNNLCVIMTSSGIQTLTVSTRVHGYSRCNYGTNRSNRSHCHHGLWMQILIYYATEQKCIRVISTVIPVSKADCFCSLYTVPLRSAGKAC